MPSYFTAKQERMAKHIETSCLDRGKSAKTCKIIANATVNKLRRRTGKAQGSRCTCPVGANQRKGKCYSRKTKRRVGKVCPR